jgi:small-conductance mechanosensitive channel
VLVVTALLAAAQLGIDISLLVLLAAVLLGTVGLVVALSLGVGLAPLSGNIAAGRYVQGNDIQVGDEISVDGVAGVIENLGYASVTLRSEDGSLRYVPNRVLLEGIVTKRP